jgi:hypothetical protein
MIKNFFLGVALLVLSTGCVYACDDCDERGVIDGDAAYAHSLREGRDTVEGFWGIYVDWHPDEDTSMSYRLAIVENIYDVYPEADYLGVATCDLQGCVKGEVKLLLAKTEKENEFRATLITKSGGGEGTAFLVDADDGRKSSAIDMRGVKYNGHTMAKWVLRIKGG